MTLTTVPKLTKLDYMVIASLGLSQEVACSMLGLSYVAYRLRISRLVRKFGVDNQRALMIKSLKLGIVPLESFKYKDYDG